MSTEAKMIKQVMDHMQSGKSVADSMWATAMDIEAAGLAAGWTPDEAVNAKAVALKFLAGQCAAAISKAVAA